MKPILVNRQFSVDYKIGQGGYGLVYAGTELKTGRPVALKLMSINDEMCILQHEADVYAALAGGTGIPRVFWCGVEHEYTVLAHELLGPTLSDVFTYCDGRFSLKTILMLADQALARLAFIHERGYMHCDIKPNNLVLGTGRQGNLLHVIDFGISRELEDTDRSIPREGDRFLGTGRYASVNCHMGREPSWGDDLESLGYVMLYWARGSLPWPSFNFDKEKDERRLAKQTKISMSTADLCESLPEEFCMYMDHVRSLKFREKPNYAYLRGLFSKLFKARGFSHDYVYDWTEKRFHELHADALKGKATSPSLET